MMDREETIKQLDNLKIAIKGLKGEHNPLDKYRAICCVDDPEVRDALMWLTGISEYSVGRTARYLISSEQLVEYDSNTDHWQDKALEENNIHYDDVDRLGERGFELFVEEKGILIK